MKHSTQILTYTRGLINGGYYYNGRKMLTIIMIEIIYDGREGATSKNKGKFLE